MKRIIFRIAILLVATVLVAAMALVFFGIRKGIRISQARYIESQPGNMVYLDDMPVLVAGNEGLFRNLSTGDLVLLVHSPIRESYPGQTKGYLCIKRAEGTQANLPKGLIRTLRESGWLAGEPVKDWDETESD